MSSLGKAQSKNEREDRAEFQLGGIQFPIDKVL